MRKVMSVEEKIAKLKALYFLLDEVGEGLRDLEIDAYQLGRQLDRIEMEIRRLEAESRV